MPRIQAMDTKYPLLQKGFSLLELMVVLAIVSIAVAIGLPSYQSTMSSNRVTAASNNILGALQLARSEAAARRSTVTVCASNDQSTCSGAWSDGGVVRTNTGTVIRTIPVANEVTISGSAISFRSDGTSAGGSISVGDRTVTVNAIGISKVE